MTAEAWVEAWAPKMQDEVVNALDALIEAKEQQFQAKEWNAINEYLTGVRNCALKAQLGEPVPGTKAKGQERAALIAHAKALFDQETGFKGHPEGSHFPRHMQRLLELGKAAQHARMERQREAKGKQIAREIRDDEDRGKGKTGGGRGGGRGGRGRAGRGGAAQAGPSTSAARQPALPRAQEPAAAPLGGANGDSDDDHAGGGEGDEEDDEDEEQQQRGGKMGTTELERACAVYFLKAWGEMLTVRRQGGWKKEDWSKLAEELRNEDHVARTWPAAHAELTGQHLSKFVENKRRYYRYDASGAPFPSALTQPPVADTRTAAAHAPNPPQEDCRSGEEQVWKRRGDVVLL
jgi:hypothetical protein